ncbi:MAG: IreB family regulatory phosphoprotein [Clostridia bacterium]|nr:IreB family regulatory phosphoprotein [Clostridia bacterium]
MPLAKKNGETQTFEAYHDTNDEMKRILQTIYAALSEKGYNPVNQIVGYLLTEDPTYITNHKSARSLVRHIDRDELLNALVRNYLGV